jgi:hypothetical protein
MLNLVGRQTSRRIVQQCITDIKRDEKCAPKVRAGTCSKEATELFSCLAGKEERDRDRESEGEKAQVAERKEMCDNVTT